MGMDIMFAAQLISGLICKWRHKQLWTLIEVRVFPAEQYRRTLYNCPTCGEVAVIERMSDVEAALWLRRPRAPFTELSNPFARAAASSKE